MDSITAKTRVPGCLFMFPNNGEGTETDQAAPFRSEELLARWRDRNICSRDTRTSREDHGHEFNKNVKTCSPSREQSNHRLMRSLPPLASIQSAILTNQRYPTRNISSGGFEPSAR